MQENDFSASLLNDFQPFQVIEGIKFTRREIDIIACLLKGRTQKTIAHFLSIAPRTVETHLRNIMLKLECNSREGIIDFIESSGKASAFRNRYQALLIQAEFEKQLQAIAQHIKEKNYTCRLLYEKLERDKFFLIEDHLKRVGIKIAIEEVKEASIIVSSSLKEKVLERQTTLYIVSKESLVYFIDLSKENLTTKEFDDLFILLWEQKSSLADLQIPKGINYINFYKSYYLSFFEILKFICFDTSIESVVSTFNRKYELLQADSSQVDYQKKIERNEFEGLPLDPENKTVLFDFKRYFLSVSVKRFIAGVLIIIVLVSGTIVFRRAKGGDVIDLDKVGSQEVLSKVQVIHSDLVIPKASAFLQRPLLIAEIDDALKDQKGIQTVALVGIGGIGKTTLARQYARQQECEVIWEINAETDESLKGSFESLAQALARSQKDQKLLAEIQEIQDAKEKDERILKFVKGHLKNFSCWCLIYDNLENLSCIHTYFPHNSETWGAGKVILTTRDSTICNGNYINNIIDIKPLSDDQKINLFNKILNHGKTCIFAPYRAKEVKDFLKKIPPFPLDISLAGYYLKTVNISFENYLNYISTYNNLFEDIQKSILKEAGEYVKTRYNIIALPLQHIIDTNVDFKDLFLIISLLDSQEIPRDFLQKYKNEIIIDNFIYNLKKYSLITHTSFSASSAISIHRSTQAISLDYLKRTLNLENNKNLVSNISETLETYIDEIIDKEDYVKIKKLLTHTEALLNHNSILTRAAKCSLESKLGCIYFYLGNYDKAKQLLEASLSDLNSLYGKNHIKTAWSLTHLGNVYRKLGNYDKARVLLNQSLLIYQSQCLLDHIRISQVLGYLAMLYKTIGNYEKARDTFEQSLLILNKLNDEIHSKRAWVLSHLGDVYRNLGNIEKAKDLLEYSLEIYKKYIPENYTRTAQVLSYLGMAYKSLGYYEKAKDILELSLTTYKKHFPEDHIYVAGALVYLGDVYNELKNYEKARDLLDRSLIIYRKIVSEDHVYFAWALGYLGSAYKGLGKYETAKSFLKRNLSIYEKHYGRIHIQTGRVLKELGQVYLLENRLNLAESNIIEALKIFEHYKHPDIYICLETLATIYIKKSNEERDKDKKQYQYFKEKGVNYLKQALNNIKIHFSKDSQHIKRILYELNKIS